MEQGVLKLQAKRDEVADSAISKCKDLRAAIRLCIETSGLQVKEVAFDLNLNKDHLSRMVNNDGDPRHFPPELIDKLQDVCGNEIPLRWQAMRRNYGLYELKSAQDLKIERLELELEEERREKSLMMKIVKEMRG
jgi:plasmid maintenance system antidote protein VapI